MSGLSLAPAPQNIADISVWLEGVEQGVNCLRRRLSFIVSGGGHFPARWAFKTQDEILDELTQTFSEAELVASFQMIASVEAAMHEAARECQGSAIPPPSSNAAGRSSFEDLCDWCRKDLGVTTPKRFEHLKTWSTFRNWFAHGRHWDAKIGRRVIGSAHTIKADCQNAVNEIEARLLNLRMAPAGTT